MSTGELKEFDEFADYDGAYVLGALSGDDRAAFEVHLLGCAACRARVDELADMPGLLALVPAPAFAPAQASLTDPVVTLLATAWARRRRQRWIAAAGAAVAAAIVIAVTVTITHDSTAAKPAAASAPAVTMSAVVPAPIRAAVEVSDVAWGTSIRLQCTYDKAATYPSNVQYTLVVQNRAGQTDNLGTWALVPGTVTNFAAGTAIHKADIKSITVDTASGTTLLQLQY